MPGQLLLKHLYILFIWGKKERKYIIKKKIVFFSKMFFFVYASGVFLGCTKMLFNGKNNILSFVDVFLCLIHEDTFLYTFCILDIYQLFTLMFLTIILTLHIDSAR